MRTILAPMQGVTDFQMRHILTHVCKYDRCVTEFVRVTNTVYPEKVFLRACPEITRDGHTASGTPVFVQLLGSDANALAANAVEVVKLGAVGVDINFGCPAKTVNRHGGGSALLRTPEVVEHIVTAVRDAVDPDIPVTAKVRLGFDNTQYFEEVAGRIQDAGASELCVHARTRTDGYKPPARWAEIQRIKSSVSIPVIVNGEIWSPEDAIDARKQSGCDDIMLGRGALAVPDLARQISAQDNHMAIDALQWHEVLDLLNALLQSAIDIPVAYAGNRTKQWLTYLVRGYPEAKVLFKDIKTLKEVRDMSEEILRHRATLTAVA